jgi:glutathione S-transferase/catechol 2,3-dioxygenase-like lactoylglutathione lyase family enzyme
MRLIGMLDSPYVRRVAVSLACLDVPFEHEAVSVISTFEQFQRINPVVKAPTLVCDDGEVLMDSSLILQFVEATCTQGRSLWPESGPEFQHDMRAVSLALAACEKGVQTIYERKLRPPAKQHEPWLERVQTQLQAALQALEQEVQHRPQAFGKGFSQASITAAIAWQFLHGMQAEALPASTYPALAALAARLEATDAFKRFPPVGPGVKPPEQPAPASAAPKLGYTIAYVPDVAASLAFFERAFGLPRRFLHESGTYGELDTGATTLSFAAHELGDMNFPGGHVAAHNSAQPLGMEVALVTDDVTALHARALAAGAREMAAPTTKPWGQTVSWVRSPDGLLIELCTPVG